MERVILGAIFLGAVSLLLWAQNHFAKLHQPSQHRGRIAADGAGSGEGEVHRYEQDVRRRLHPEAYGVVIEMPEHFHAGRNAL